MLLCAEAKRRPELGNLGAMTVSVADYRGPIRTKWWKGQLQWRAAPPLTPLAVSATPVPLLLQLGI